MHTFEYSSVFLNLHYFSTRFAVSSEKDTPLESTTVKEQIYINVPVISTFLINWSVENCKELVRETFFFMEIIHRKNKPQSYRSQFLWPRNTSVSGVIGKVNVLVNNLTWYILKECLPVEEGCPALSECPLCGAVLIETCWAWRLLVHSVPCQNGIK